MEPIPESVEAVEEFGPFVPDGDLLEDLRAKAVQVRDIVPECVGLSVAVLGDGVVLTLVSSDAEIAALDALQYLDGGPCVHSAAAGEVVVFSHDSSTDEERWQTFARGTAARSVGSTLTLPVLEDDRVIGSVNLYAATAHAFDGHHEAVADVFHAWAAGAVSNADLDFATRREAELTPQRLREGFRSEVAAGLLASRAQLGLTAARERLREAATRAGVGVEQLAELLIELYRPVDD